MTINFNLPTDARSQLLVGALFAESSTRNYGGGENPAEKTAIAQAIINMAFYAAQRTMNGTRCYNDSFGDGTILGAIRRAIVAYGQTRWNLVMSANQLKSKAELERVLTPDDVEHLRGCVVAVNQIGNAAAPLSNNVFGRRIPLQFNQAANSPPSPRTERIGREGAHTFYAFKIGRECQ